MGSACCVAARDKTTVSASVSEVPNHRNVRHSPSWSFRWENRGRVAGEETSISWLSDGVSGNGGSDVKYESEEGSPMESFVRHTGQKSPISEGATMHARTPTSDLSRNFSMDASSEQVKELADSSSVSDPSPSKLSVSFPSASYQSQSPQYSQNRNHPASLTASRWHSLINKRSETRAPEFKSSSTCSVARGRPAISSWSNESARGSCDDSSDGWWSMQAYPELVAACHKESWSFDSEPMNFNNEKSRSCGRVSDSSSVDLQACGICTKLLTERSLWSNELSVVAVLNCGHTYHAECLESMTPEISKYDPACPLCTLGAKQILKLRQKAIKAELDSKARNKGSKNRIVDRDFDCDSYILDGMKGSGREGKSQKMASSSSTKSFSAKPFLRRHFSIGSKSQTNRRKGFFWTRSLKN